MKALAFERYGTEEVLEYVELREPEPGEGEVRVHVMAAGLSAFDALLCAGRWRDLLRPRLPLVIGSELSGVVDKVGPGVSRFRPGDEVWAFVDPERSGAMAELVVARQEELAIKPERLSHVQAASLPLPLLASWQALVERAGLSPHQKVLVQAGSGGVGNVAVQLTEHLGAFASTTGSARNLYYLLDLGATRSIDTYMTRFETIVPDRHIVLDSVGGKVTRRSIACTRRGGAVVTLTPPPDAATVRARGGGPLARAAALTRHVRHHVLALRRGVRWGTMLTRPDGARLQALGELVDAGAIEPQVSHIYPFEEANLGYIQVNGRSTRGKRVVAVDRKAAEGQSPSESVLNDSRSLFSNAAKRSKGPAASSSTTRSPETKSVTDKTQSSEP